MKKKKSTANGKVIHISDEMHRDLKKFCDKQNVSMRSFVEDSLDVCLGVAKEMERNAR